jgi:hypothetical protein
MYYIKISSGLSYNIKFNILFILLVPLCEKKIVQPKNYLLIIKIM